MWIQRPRIRNDGTTHWSFMDVLCCIKQESFPPFFISLLLKPNTNLYLDFPSFFMFLWCQAGPRNRPYLIMPFKHSQVQQITEKEPFSLKNIFMFQEPIYQLSFHMCFQTSLLGIIKFQVPHLIGSLCQPKHLHSHRGCRVGSDKSCPCGIDIIQELFCPAHAALYNSIVFVLFMWHGIFLQLFDTHVIQQIVTLHIIK